ncbi:MAG: response regulator [PVC group bacterium]
MRKIRVLIVDDDRDLCDNLSKILSLDDRETEVAFDGADALVKLRRREYDVLVLDIKMPGMDGIQLLQEIQDRSGNTAVIILTAYPTLETAMDAVGDRMIIEYVRKPFSMQQIRNAVGKAAASIGLVSCPPENLNERVGALVRRRRNLKEMGGRELARAAGLSPSLLSQVESGKSAASLKTLYQIAKALDLSVSDLLQDL